MLVHRDLLEQGRGKIPHLSLGEGLELVHSHLPPSKATPVSLSNSDFNVHCAVLAACLLRMEGQLRTG